MNKEIEIALEIALEIHKGQVDKCGRPYILHVLRVASKAKNDVELVTALLHDAVEDSKGALDVLDLVDDFPDEVCTAVLALTRLPDESYKEYINNISNFPLATRIKLYDLEDNLDYRRQAFIGAESLMRRYEEAQRFLIHKVAKNLERYSY